ncbi:MAG: hypothetical protein LBD37_08290 [Treponema sp.]|nr:hypothetical protein [Treponema sp.]
MVKGEWIFLISEMRCKNWANGLEFTFFLNEQNLIEGKITAIPPDILKNFNMPWLIIYLLRAWRQTTMLFKKAYYKKHRRGACCIAGDGI